MTTLADAVKVETRFARSANVERDITRSEPFDGYIVTARAAEVVERVASAAAACTGGGAWSLTGPYGSGKSSLALLLDAVFGPLRDATPMRALQLLRDAAPSTADLVERAQDAYDTRAGFLRGVVTADREPITHTVLRALHSAVIREWGRMPTKREFGAADVLRHALDDAASADPRRTGPSPTALVTVARTLAEISPLLLIIDEFGKNIEAVRDDRQTDPYLLQQLAEAGQGGTGLPIFLLTLQHLSFEDYFVGQDIVQRREWAKVQGRFEDIPYIESASQTRALVSTVFAVEDDALGRRVRTWARSQAQQMAALGLAELGDPDLIAACYPLQPITLAVLPELCSRYGQNERTLFSFLTGIDSSSVASFLARSIWSKKGVLPSVGLDQVYDYFVAAGTLTAGGGPSASRWTEIATRIRDASGLSAPQRKLLKTIAVLNLVSTGGPLRASRSVLACCHDAPDDDLAALEAGGLVTHRTFADEYRVWQGSDVDIRALVESARGRIQKRTLADLLTDVDAPTPVVAARHSAEHDQLRVFGRRYVGDGAALDPPGPFDPIDGLLVYVVGPTGELPKVNRADATAKPVVAAIPESIKDLHAAAVDTASLIAALGEPRVTDDWVAKRELGEQAAQARRELEALLNLTFGDTARCRTILIESKRNVTLKGGRGSAPLSDAADRRFLRTPIVRNEMLNRAELSSQGAKARRVLLEAMLETGDIKDLGFEGYGPEMAMYRAVLRNTGIHHYDGRNQRWVFRKPTDGSMIPAWEAIEDQFQRARGRRVNLRDLYATLQSPPYGMKNGAVPVLVTSALLAARDEVAIYEHGTFKPILSPDVSERMVRNPAHFELKHFANTSGGRREAVEAIAQAMGIQPRYRRHRVSNVLSIVGELVATAASLESFTKRTKDLPPSALSLRAALLQAVEPDELLFASAPTALGFPPVTANESSYPQAEALAGALHSELMTLRRRYRSLLSEIVARLLESTAGRSRRAVAAQADSLESQVLDPAIRAFVLSLGTEAYEDDEEWAENVATVVARKAPAEWTDDDRARFERELPEHVAAFLRLRALHAERSVTGAGGFDAVRVTVTRQDGYEEARLATVDEQDRAAVEAAVERMLEGLAGELGSPSVAYHASLAVLAGHLVAADPKSEGLPSRTLKRVADA